MPPSVAIPTMGTIIRLNGVAIGQIGDIDGPDLSTDTDEITNHSSPDQTEEKIATVKRTGEISFPLVFYPGDANHMALFQAWKDRSKDEYEMVYPDETGTADAGAEWTFDAYCTGFKMGAPWGGHLTADIVLTPASAPDFAAVGS